MPHLDVRMGLGTPLSPTEELGVWLDADDVRGMVRKPRQMEAGPATDVEDGGPDPGAEATDLGIDQTVGVGGFVFQLVDSRELPDVRRRGGAVSDPRQGIRCGRRRQGW